MSRTLATIKRPWRGGKMSCGGGARTSSPKLILPRFRLTQSGGAVKNGRSGDAPLRRDGRKRTLEAARHGTGWASSFGKGATCEKRRRLPEGQVDVRMSTLREVALYDFSLYSRIQICDEKNDTISLPNAKANQENSI